MIPTIESPSSYPIFARQAQPRVVSQANPSMVSAGGRVFGIFMGLQYYGPPVSPNVYERVAATARRFPVLCDSMCRP